MKTENLALRVFDKDNIDQTGHATEGQRRATATAYVDGYRSCGASQK